MSDASHAPLISPGGRFEVVREETHDRFETLYDTVLVERATGERLFSYGGLPRAEFAAEGTLSLGVSGHTRGEMQIDPSRRVFRTGRDGAWLPLAAWPTLEAAYRRGRADGIGFQEQDGVGAFPWVEASLLAG